MKPSVVHVVGDSKAGGVTRVVQAICQDSDAFDFTVVTTDPMFISRLNELNIKAAPIQFVTGGFQGLGEISGLWRLVRYLRTTRPDVVHTHRTKSGYVGRFAAKLARVPKIMHTVHGLPYAHDGPTWKRTTIMAMEVFFSKHTDTSVAVSDTLAASLRRGVVGIPAKNVHVIPNGIATPILSTINAASPDQFPALSNSGELTLVYVGRLAEQKGLIFLIEAMASIRATVNVRLHIFGEGELRTSLERASSDFGVSDVVHFHGFAPNPQEAMAKADIVVLPSLWEGLSIALLEAMSLGKPIVTTSIPSNREVIEDDVSGILVPARDPGALTSAIVRVAQDPELSAALGEEARHKYLSEYRQESMVESYHDLYTTLASAM